jgi:hypothetical protein
MVLTISSLMDYRFRLVEFQLKYVLSQGSPANIKAALAENFLPKSLPDAYRKVMNQMDEGQKRFAFQIMSWIFHAARLLTIDELSEALSVVDDSEDLEVDLIPGPESILKACESLVEVDKISREVRFTHQTVDDFLRNYCAAEMLSVVDLAKTCLIYLGFSGFDHACRDGMSLYMRCQNYKFCRYAANAWGVHTRGAGENNVDIRKRLYAAFKSVEKAHSLHQIAEAEKLQEPSLFSNPPGRSFLHITALHGLATIGRILLDKNSEEVGRCFKIFTCFANNKTPAVHTGRKCLSTRSLLQHTASSGCIPRTYGRRATAGREDCEFH